MKNPCQPFLKYAEKSREYFVERMSIVYDGFYYNRSMEGISFKVSQQATLTDVALYLPCVEGILSGAVEVLENESVIAIEHVTLQYQNGIQFQLVPLKKALPLSSKNIYSIRQSLSGVQSHYGKTYRGKQTLTILRLSF